MARTRGATSAMSASTSAALGKTPRSGDCPARNGAKETELNRSAGSGTSPACSRFGSHHASAVRISSRARAGRCRMAFLCPRFAAASRPDSVTTKGGPP